MEGKEVGGDQTWPSFLDQYTQLGSRSDRLIWYQSCGDCRAVQIV